MTNPLLLDIVTFFTDNRVVQGDGIDAFRDFTPEAPDSIVVLNEYKGESAIQYEPIAHRSVQVVVRDKDADIARQRALQAYELLRSENLIVNFTPSRWGQVYLRQPPFKLGIDSNDRVSYCFNIGVTTTIE